MWKRRAFWWHGRSIRGSEMCRRCCGGKERRLSWLERIPLPLHPSGQEVRFGQRLQAGPEDIHNSQVVYLSIFSFPLPADHCPTSRYLDVKVVPHGPTISTRGLQVGSLRVALALYCSIPRQSQSSSSDLSDHVTGRDQHVRQAMDVAQSNFKSCNWKSTCIRPLEQLLTLISNINCPLLW